MKLVSFDLEIAKEIPEYTCPVCGCDNIQVHDKTGMCLGCHKINSIFEFKSDWKVHRPLGITCAATHNGISPSFKMGKPKMSKGQAMELVYQLLDYSENEMIVGWNSLSFDMDVLAEESGMYDECKELALNHVDLMFIVVTLRGHYLGLDKASKGATIQGKLKQVTLDDGTVLDDMSGSKAPSLWAKGEYQAVLDYLADDVRSTLELAEWVRDNKMIRWISERGYEQKIHVPKLYTVKECLELNPVLPSWVTEPVEIKSMMEWINV